MTHKSETHTHLVNFVSYIQTQFSARLKCIRTNNGSIFLMNYFYKTHGILQH